MLRKTTLIIFAAVASVTLHAQSSLTLLDDASPPINTIANELGHAVVWIGDVNDDGFDDFVAGAPQSVFGKGKVTCYAGPDGAILWTTHGAAIGDEFGFSLGRLPDANFDGKDEVLVGAPGADGLAVDSGVVYVLEPDTGAIRHTVSGLTADERLGWAVVGIEDMNGGGANEFFASAPFYDGVAGPDCGIVRQWYVTPAGTGALDSLEGEAQWDRFGYAMAVAGEWDGYPYPDLAVSAPWAHGPGGFIQLNHGKVYVFSRDLEYSSVVDVFYGSQSGSEFGASLAGVGDVDGDLLDELAIGEPDYNGGPIDTGRVSVVDRIDTVMRVIAEGTAANDRLGRSLGVAPDLDDDGLAEVLIGATQVTGDGYVMAVRGLAPYTITDTISGTAGGDFGVSVSGGGDYDGNGAGDVLIGGGAMRELQVWGLQAQYPGSNEDLILTSSVNGQHESLFPDVRSVNPGDATMLRLSSPEGGYLHTVPIIAAQFFTTGAPPTSPTGFPEVHMNPNQVIIVHDGNNSSLFAPSILPEPGIVVGMVIPPGLNGNSLVFQGVAIAPSANTGNPIFTTTSGLELQL